MVGAFVTTRSVDKVPFSLHDPNNDNLLDFALFDKPLKSAMEMMYRIILLR